MMIASFMDGVRKPVLKPAEQMPVLAGDNPLFFIRGHGKQSREFH
jgi:hypothetical protein